MFYTVINHLCGSAANGEEAKRQTVDMSKTPTPMAGAGGAMKSVPLRPHPGAPPATGRPPSTDETSINVQFKQKRDTSLPRDRLSSVDLEDQQDAGVNRNARLAVSAPPECRSLEDVVLSTRVLVEYCVDQWEPKHRYRHPTKFPHPCPPSLPPVPARLLPSPPAPLRSVRPPPSLPSIPLSPSPSVPLHPLPSRLSKTPSRSCPLAGARFRRRTGRVTFITGTRARGRRRGTGPLHRRVCAGGFGKWLSSLLGVYSKTSVIYLYSSKYRLYWQDNAYLKDTAYLQVSKKCSSTLRLHLCKCRRFLSPRVISILLLG
jgi:hypothetical protein